VSRVAKKPFLKPNPVGFGFYVFNVDFVKRPNLTGSGISMGFQLLE